MEPAQGTRGPQLQALRPQITSMSQASISRSAIPPSFFDQPPGVWGDIGFPDEVLGLILSMSASPNTFRVSKKFLSVENRDEIWEGMAKRLDWLYISAKPGNWKDEVRKSCTQYVKSIASLKEASPDVIKLLKTELSIETMNILREWRSARDTLVIWTELARLISNSDIPNKESYNNLEGMVTQAAKFSQWVATNIDALVLIETLNLRENNLATLPPEIGGLTGLTELNLSQNQIMTLPPEIGNLVMLEILSLQYNLLVALPPEIGRLAGLENIFIHNNERLTALPLAIFDIPPLGVHLDFELFEVLPQEIRDRAKEKGILLFSLKPKNKKLLQ